MANEQEINRKRKNNTGEENEPLTLSLSLPPTRHRYQESPLQPAIALSLSPPSSSLQSLLTPPPPQLPLQLSPSHPIYVPPPPPPPSQKNVGPSRVSRSRRNSCKSPREGKSYSVPAPFPWATTHRATVHSLSFLVSNQIFKIRGSVQCKRCERVFEIEYDLVDKFNQVATFIAKNKGDMHDRAPSLWMNPVLPTCKFCKQENSVKPIIADKKKCINWLFLLLGQMLGCCTLEQLKYFCKHTKNHRTGAKDRVLYLTYLGLCKQLDPITNGHFDR